MSHRSYKNKELQAFLTDPAASGQKTAATLGTFSDIMNALVTHFNMSPEEYISETFTLLKNHLRNNNTPSQPPQAGATAAAAAGAATAPPAPTPNTAIFSIVSEAYGFLDPTAAHDRFDYGAMPTYMSFCKDFPKALRHYVEKMDKYFPPCKRRYFRVDHSAYAFVAASHTGIDPANSNRAMIERFSIMVGFTESELNVAMLVMEWACAGKVSFTGQHTPLGVIKLRHLLGRFAFVLAFVTDVASYHNVSADEARRAFDAISRAIDTTRPNDSIFGPLALNADGKSSVVASSFSKRTSRSSQRLFVGRSSPNSATSLHT